MTENLAGKVAIITGGGSGIGLAIARRLAALGVTTLLVGRTKDKLAKAVTTIEGDARFIVADVSRDADVETLFAQERRVDILVCCAGGAVFGPVEEVTPDDVRTFFASKVFGQMTAAHYAVPLMTRGGVIIFCSGVGDVVGLPFYSAGSAVDGAINAFARALAVELGGRGIRVNAISPGIIDSGIGPSKGAEYVEAFSERALSLTPLGRAGVPDDVADAAVYFATAPYASGQVIEIDGGWSAV